MLTIRDRYESDIEKGIIRRDAAQEKIVYALNDLEQKLETINKAEYPKWLFFLKPKKRSHPRGMYIYGPVGRGKSYLMDLFYDHVHIRQKRRVHFHEFMLSVHEFIHQQQKQNKDMDKALPEFAVSTAKQIQLLCFDEFHVTDIADAMILKKLFRLLWDGGVTIVLTTNWWPDDLYLNGIQRDRFIPFIDDVKHEMDVFELDSGVDYRQEKIKDKNHYLWPDDEYAKEDMDDIFFSLSSGKQVKSETLTIKGHDLFIPEQAEGVVARFDYDDIIAKAYAAEDFLKLTHAYPYILIDHVKAFSADNNDEAKRFMTLIDAVYDHHGLVIISADVKMFDLYKKGPLKFEFDRTLSRLQEMQSSEYKVAMRQ